MCLTEYTKILYYLLDTVANTLVSHNIYLTLLPIHWCPTIFTWHCCQYTGVPQYV